MHRAPHPRWLSWPAAFVLAAAAAGQAPVDFNRDIRPILSDRCFPCHGFDARARKAGLRLDTQEGMTTPIDGRTPVVPGDPGRSELVRRITSTDDRVRMPPPRSDLTLSSDEVALLRRWIAEGAVYAPHWAFVPPVAPPVPDVDPALGARNEVDRFVQARLAKAGLRLSPEADRRTLIRRLSLDLDGLPPTPAEVEAFVADPWPDAYDRLVDRLLASPRFGERMALVWLDAARYADTNGFHHDNVRTAWPYRDWVIDAFNSNLPYDRFVVDQLAGDLLPHPTQADRVATAFCRMHNINDEGGALDPEYRVLAVADRIETVSTVFMGLTFTCCRCHDHKYDPFTQEDYYSLYAFFDSVDERGVYPNNFEQARAYPARLRYHTAAQSRQLADVDGELAAVRAELAAAAPAIDRERQQWRERLWQRLGLGWVDAPLVSAKSAAGTALERLDDGSVRASGKPEKDTFTLVYRTDATGLRLLCFEALADPALAGGRVGLARNGNAVVSSIDVEAVSVRDPERRQKVAWSWAWADHEQSNDDYDVRNLLTGEGYGWALDGHNRRDSRTALLAAAEPFGFEGGTELRVTVACRSRFAGHVVGRPRVTFARSAGDLRGELPTVRSDWWLAGPFVGKSFEQVYAHEFGPEHAKAIDGRERFGKLAWRQRADIREGVPVALTGERSAFYLGRVLHSPVARTLSLGLGSDDALRVYLDGTEVLDHKVERGVAPDQDQLELEVPAGDHLLVAKVVNDAGPAGFCARLSDPAKAPTRLQPVALLPAACDAALRRRFADEWGRAHSPTFARLDAEVRRLQERREKVEAEAVPVLAMRELDEPTPTHVLTRGRYDMPDMSRPVHRRVPRILGHLPQGAPRNRLGFAQWLVQPDHPLLARVHVNRLWQMLFGTGIVPSLENLGQQSDWPSHPQLLDWLAVRLVESGWDQKALIRLLVESATYRQSSRVRPDALAVDPRNRLLAYFPRRRLAGELVRDLALYTSGLLVERRGGPSVKPYQPAGLWREVSIGKSSNTREFVRDAGDALYRRSLYTFWKRTSPSPQMTTFDAPTREFCVVQRNTTNTPLQALVLWNDVQFVEAARALAQRTLAAPGATAERLATMFERCTGRPPGDREAAVLRGLLQDFRRRYGAAPDDARALLAEGELAVPENLEPTELAAWTMVANALLSMDETIVRG